MRAKWSAPARVLSRRRSSEALATAVASVFVRAGVVCEESDDPVGVELAGVAKNAAALASGATVAQGLNVAGAAAGHIFSEVWRWAEARGARPVSMIGLAGTGDLVATALAPESRNRRAGELLADGIPAAEIAARVGQAVEALETVPLLSRALAGSRRRGAGHERTRPADRGRASARRMGRDRPHHDPASSAPTSPGSPGFWRRLVNWISSRFGRVPHTEPHD